MPTFLTRPDPIFTSIQAVVQQAQFEREQRELERAESRAAKKKRLGTGIGIVAGALTGGALAGAGAAAGGAGAGVGTVAGGGAAGAGINAVAASGITASTAGFSAVGALEGGLLGGQLGATFSGAPEIAAGFGLASGAMKTFVQNMDDAAVFGGPISKEEKSSIMKGALKAGLNLRAAKQEARGGGRSMSQQIAEANFENADREAIQGTLDAAGIPITTDIFNEEVEARRREGSRTPAVDALNFYKGEIGVFENKLEAEGRFRNAIAETAAQVQGGLEATGTTKSLDPQDTARFDAERNSILNNRLTTDAQKSIQLTGMDPIRQKIVSKQAQTPVELAKEAQDRLAGKEVISERTGITYIEDARADSTSKHTVVSRPSDDQEKMDDRRSKTILGLHKNLNQFGSSGTVDQAIEDYVNLEVGLATVDDKVAEKIAIANAPAVSRQQNQGLVAPGAEAPQQQPPPEVIEQQRQQQEMLQRVQVNAKGIVDVFQKHGENFNKWPKKAKVQAKKDAVELSNTIQTLFPDGVVPPELIPVMEVAAKVLESK